MTPEEQAMVLARVTYKPGYWIEMKQDPGPEGRFYIQAVFTRTDIVTFKEGTGYGGKRYLSPHMTVSELVRLAFGAFLAVEEHECREWFKWAPHGEAPRRIFGPHIDVHALYDVARDIDVRSDPLL